MFFVELASLRVTLLLPCSCLGLEGRGQGAVTDIFSVDVYTFILAGYLDPTCYVWPCVASLSQRSPLGAAWAHQQPLDWSCCFISSILPFWARSVAWAVELRGPKVLLPHFRIVSGRLQTAAHISNSCRTFALIFIKLLQKGSIFNQDLSTDYLTFTVRKFH